MPPSFTLRLARASDAPLVHRFIVALAEYEHLAHEVVATVDDVRASLFGARPQAEVLLAFAADPAMPDAEADPAGFALFFHNYSTFLARHGLYLEDLFVEPRWRGLGLGQRLLVELARIAVERGCGRLEWWVLDWNETAIGFYRRLGARAMDEWTVYRLDGEALRRLAGHGGGEGGAAAE